MRSRTEAQPQTRNNKDKNPIGPKNDRKPRRSSVLFLLEKNKCCIRETFLCIIKKKALNKINVFDAKSGEEFIHGEKKA